MNEMFEQQKELYEKIKVIEKDNPEYAKLLKSLNNMRYGFDYEIFEKPKCIFCDSENVFGISRVVGYFSIIDNWNKSKQAELKARKKGNYWFDEK